MPDLDAFRASLLDPDAELDEDDARMAARGDAEWVSHNAADIARAHPELYRHLILALAAEDSTSAVIAGIAIVKAKAIPEDELRMFLSWHAGQPWAFVVTRSLDK